MWENNKEGGVFLAAPKIADLRVPYREAIGTAPKKIML